MRTLAITSAAILLSLLIVVLSVPLSLAEGPIDDGYAICLATAREAEGAIIRSGHGGLTAGDPSQFPAALDHSGRYPVPIRLLVGQLALARPIEGWSAEGWCEVTGLQGIREYGKVPYGLTGGGNYARASGLTAIPWETLARDRVRDRIGLRGNMVELRDGFATEFLQVKSTKLEGRRSASTVVYSQWARTVFGQRWSIYDVDKGGRPVWHLAKFLSPAVWSDPQVRLVHGKQRSETVAVLVLDPPLLVSVYGWRGDKLTSIPLPWTCVDDLVVVVFRSTWRWIVLAAVVLTPFAVVRGIRRRKVRAGAAP